MVRTVFLLAYYLASLICCNFAAAATCGDLIVQEGEECDAGLGNGRNGVGCRADCTLPVCGDGHRAPGEYCDDGNVESGDGCSADCVTEHTFPRLSEPENAQYEVAAPLANTVFGDPHLRTLENSEHFVIRATFNDQDLLEEEMKGGMLTKDMQKESLAKLETAWAKYIDEFGFAPPYFERPEQYKVNVFVSDYGYLSGGTFQQPQPWPEGSHCYIQMLFEVFDGYEGMLHEFAHCLQNIPPRADWFEFGGWFSESHAEFMTYRANPTGVGCSEALVNCPHLYYGTTRNRYCNWQFWDYLAETFGMPVVNNLWTGSLGGATDKLFPNNENIPAKCQNLDGPFAVLLRNLDWNIEQLNDIFGRWAMANVAWDYDQKGDVYRDTYGTYSEDLGAEFRGRLTRLESHGGSNDLFYSPPEVLAPQRWGYNLVRLVPLGESDSVVVQFRGVVQTTAARTKEFGNFNNEPSEIPQPDSGWRWGLVAIDVDGFPRYSSLQAGARASLRFKIETNDRELYLMVMGAPMSLHQIFWDQMYYSIYRFPWRVRLEGAVPQGFEPSVPLPEDVPGGAHPNGGGFVANTAEVAPEAYVGLRARVLDYAKIGSGVRIEDWAIVRGYAEVMGNAKVKENALLEGYAVVTDNATVFGSAQMSGGKVYENAQVGGLTSICCEAEIYGSAKVISTNTERPLTARVHGDTQLLGDVEMHVEDISSGVWYGFIHPEFMGDPKWGSNRTEPEPEVTISTNGIDWDTDNADCRYAHVGCPASHSCILVDNIFDCVPGKTAPISYERSHTEMIVKCVESSFNDNMTSGSNEGEDSWEESSSNEDESSWEENGSNQMDSSEEILDETSSNDNMESGSNEGEDSWEESSSNEGEGSWEESGSNEMDSNEDSWEESGSMGINWNLDSWDESRSNEMENSNEDESEYQFGGALSYPGEFGEDEVDLALEDTLAQDDVAKEVDSGEHSSSSSSGNRLRVPFLTGIKVLLGAVQLV